MDQQTQRDEIKVMVVGDSISHGREGDWTWRYRIWEWLGQQRVPVRFVGPYTGTSPPEAPRPPRPPRFAEDPPDPPPPFRTDGGYAAGVAREFLANSAHFSASGRQVDQAKDLIAEQVAAYEPDLCLVELGFNDLGWRWCDPVDLIAGMKHLINQARSAKPDLKFAIANIPQRTDMPGREDLPIGTSAYNALLARRIPEWSTARSPIALVRFCENYSCGGSNSDAAYDGLHPNALGEYELAKAFSQTLATAFALGRRELAVPAHIPPRPLPTPTQFQAVAAPSGVVITWDAVYGAYGYELEHRHAGDRGWTRTHLDSNRYDWQRLRRGQKVECRVRTSGGETVKSGWSGIASAVADPQTPPAPVNIASHATADGFVLSWHPPPPPFAGEIDRYGIVHFDGDQPGAFPGIVGVRGSRAEIGGFAPGHKVHITIETWSTVGGGIPASARAVVVGRGTPPAPKSVRAEALDAHTVEVRWPEVAGAAGYDVWIREERSLRGCLDPPATPKLALPLAPMACDEEPSACARTVTARLYLEPSIWAWEYAVRAYNGNDESGFSQWVTAPPLQAAEELTLTEDHAIHVEIQH